MSYEERQYENGGDPRVLDVIDVPLLGPKPKAYQQENWLLDPTLYWEHRGRAGWSDLERLADPVEPLWIDGHSTYHGTNDRIPIALSGALRSSLRLIRVEDMSVSVLRPGARFGNPKRRVQGQFRHAGRDYRLWITDPPFESTYKAKEDDEHQIGECFLTISLGEPFGDECNKLIAAVIERAKVPSA